MEERLEPKSKSQVKREMLGLQSLGEQLVELAPDQIRKIEMPRELTEAVLFAKTLRRGEAWRRQLQYIGTLMRDADPEPIQRALEIIGRGRSLEAERFQQLEQWRDALIDGREEPLEEVLHRFPAADRQRLHQLVRNARREKEGDKKASRALFRYLRELSE